MIPGIGGPRRPSACGARRTRHPVGQAPGGPASADAGPLLQGTADV